MSSANVRRHPIGHALAAVAMSLTLVGCQQAGSREPGDIRIALGIIIGCVLLVVVISISNARERAARGVARPRAEPRSDRA